VWQWLKSLQTEDKTVTSVKAFTADGAALADSTPIGHALQSPFQLSVNGSLYVVTPSAAGAFCFHFLTSLLVGFN
jgi:hypothetical protein